MNAGFTNVDQMAMWFADGMNYVLKYENRINIHITHTDMDGCGCSIVLKYLYSDIANTVFTNSLGSELYPVIKDVIHTEINSHPDVDKYGLVITDLGGLNVDKVIELLENEIKGTAKKIHVFVVDHHRVNENDVCGNTMIDCACYKNTHDKMIGQITFSQNKDASVKVWYIYQYIMSATKLLAELLRNQQFEYIFDMWSELVSNYDTGKSGQAIVDLDQCFDQYVSYIDPSVILNSEWNVDCNIPYMNTKSQDVFYDYVNNVTHRLRSGILYPLNSIDAIDIDLKNLANTYNIFESYIKNMRLSDAVTVLAHEGIELKLPDNINMNQKVAVIVDREDFNHYNFTICSKEYFRLDENVTGIFRVDKFSDFQSVSMRGSVNGMNCYEIAKCNGGGGHPGAAGFPIHVEK